MRRLRPRLDFNVFVMKLIKCTNPTIICNPYLKDLLLTYRHYVMNGVEKHLTDNMAAAMYREFPYAMFSPAVLKLSVEDLDNYYIITPDGEQYMMYILVPCGRCNLCCDSKAKQWSFRALCEAGRYTHDNNHESL